MSREKVREIVLSAGSCQMATSASGQPRVRPMKFVVTDDFKFWCTTVNISGKVQELKDNPKVELCWVARNGDHLRVAGIADLTGDAAKKKKLLELHPGALGLFTDENDPSLVHVEVVPTRVRWKNHAFCEYNEVE